MEIFHKTGDVIRTFLGKDALERAAYGVLLILTIGGTLYADHFYITEDSELTVGLLIFIGFLIFSEAFRLYVKIEKNDETAGLRFRLFVALTICVVGYWRLVYSHANDLEIWVSLLIATIFATDTFAYVFGRLIGRFTPKLAEDISPNKTWGGAIGGCLTGLTVFSYVSYNFLDVELTKAVVCGLFVVVSSVKGDLLQSEAKRKTGMDDTGEIFGVQILGPHGGFWDRFDSFVYAPLIFFII